MDKQSVVHDYVFGLSFAWSKGKRGFAITIRLAILCIVMPKTSVISKSLAVTPGGSSQSKPWRS